MSASRETVEWVKADRDDWDARLSAAGHAMTWELGPNATRKGYAYFWVGTCGHCGAGMNVGAYGSSTSVIRDARNTPCSGPGTAVLTEIEARRSAELLAPAVAELADAASRVQGRSPEGPGCGGWVRVRTTRLPGGGG